MLKLSRLSGVRVAALSILTICAIVPVAHALQLPRDATRFDRFVIPDPSLAVSPEPLAPSAALIPESAKAGWGSFESRYGTNWDVFVDLRSGAPLLVQGQGIPFVPGSGNTLRSAAPVTLESLAASLRAFAFENAALFHADAGQLVLNREASGELTPEVWKVVFDRVVAGVPVAGDRFVYYIGHGNLIALGATRWSAIEVSPAPSLAAFDAVAILLRHMGVGGDEKVGVLDEARLTYLPLAAPGTSVDSFEGVLGKGYTTALAWRVELEVEGAPGRWVGMVDSNTGNVLALYDAIQYAQVKGGAYPLTDDGICPDGCEQAGYPMPWANISIGASTATATGMGAFTCSPGGSTATTTLSAQYVRVVDSCGAISQSVTCDADLNLGVSTGTDCTVPLGSSAGNTHATRSSFYHLNRIKEHARAWLPANTWLAGQLRDNVNINQTCNAFWNSGGATGTVNFYRSGGGCRNTGEIAAVFLHEWGHGLDQNDGGGYDNPSEAYADVTSFLVTHQSCIGRGFTTSNCSGEGNACLNCTGVRDQDWNQHASHAPQTADSWPSTATCPTSGPYSFGPCGREVHCESHLPGETLWDLAARDLPASGIDQQTSWQIVDRLWYKSRTGSGGNVYSCGATVANRSCAANAWFTQLRAVDDDDGNLANGTPHAAAIFAAFNRHNIPCGTAADATNQNSTTCAALSAPVLTLTPGAGQIGLSWAPVAGATSYNVLRNDQGCGWGFTVAANVAGTTYTDTGLPNGFSMYYAVQAVGPVSACTGALSPCATAQAGVVSANLAVTKTAPPSAVAGGALVYSVSVSNAGPSAAQSVQLTDAIPAGTTFQSIAAQAGWSCSTPAVGGTGTVTCSVASLASAGVASFTITVRVNTCIGNGTLVQNTASVASPTSDPNASNNTASAVTTVSDTGACDDGNACTLTDSCQAGICVGSNPVTCAAPPACRTAAGATCNPASGQCNYPVVPDGTSCSDGDGCNGSETCQAGACSAGTPVNCVTPPPCHTAAGATCKPALGECNYPVVPNGSSCSDGDACNGGETCQSGSCSAGTAITCDGPPACHTAEGSTCNPVSGQCSYPAIADGTSCSDGDACNGSETCQSGSCSAGTPVSCATPPPCHSAAGATCDSPSGQCNYPAVPDGASCSDGNACNGSETCDAGACAAGTPIVCDAAPACHTAAGAGCDPETALCFYPALPDGEACSDGDACTAGDQCDAGSCGGGSPVPPPGPVTDLSFTDPVDKDTLGWSAVPSATAYDVVRGELSGLPVGPGGADEICLGDTAANTLDDAAVPESGFYYLVRSKSLCGSGGWGDERENTPGGSVFPPRSTTSCP